MCNDVTMDDLDDVLNRDMDGKINWLVSEVTELNQSVSTIKDNHLFHIEKDIGLLKRTVLFITLAGASLLTGVNLL